MRNLCLIKHVYIKQVHLFDRYESSDWIKCVYVMMH